MKRNNRSIYSDMNKTQTQRLEYNKQQNLKNNRIKIRIYILLNQPYYYDIVQQQQMTNPQQKIIINFKTLLQIIHKNNPCHSYQQNISNLLTIQISLQTSSTNHKTYSIQLINIYIIALYNINHNMLHNHLEFIQPFPYTQNNSQNDQNQIGPWSIMPNQKQILILPHVKQTNQKLYNCPPFKHKKKIQHQVKFNSHLHNLNSNQPHPQSFINYNTTHLNSHINSNLRNNQAFKEQNSRLNTLLTPQIYILKSPDQFVPILKRKEQKTGISKKKQRPSQKISNALYQLKKKINTQITQQISRIPISIKYIKSKSKLVPDSDVNCKYFNHKSNSYLQHPSNQHSDVPSYPTIIKNRQISIINNMNNCEISINKNIINFNKQNMKLNTSFQSTNTKRQRNKDIFQVDYNQNKIVQKNEIVVNKKWLFNFSVKKILKQKV